MEAQATATVKEALSALYHHPDDAIRTAADRWLQKFQHTLDAWQVRACGRPPRLDSVRVPTVFVRVEPWVGRRAAILGAQFGVVRAGFGRVCMDFARTQQLYDCSRGAVGRYALKLALFGAACLLLL
jgi:hypothetical protein